MTFLKLTIYNFLIIAGSTLIVVILSYVVRYVKYLKYNSGPILILEIKYKCFSLAIPVFSK